MRYIDPTGIKDHWDWVRRGLDKVIEKGGSDGWIPEDVYLALKIGRSTLHIEDGVGFVVLTPTDGFNGKKLFIWAAYAEGQGNIKKYLPEIREIAKSIGAKRIEFQSMRNYGRLFSQGMTNYYEDIL